MHRKSIKQYKILQGISILNVAQIVLHVGAGMGGYYVEFSSLMCMSCHVERMLFTKNTISQPDCPAAKASEPLKASCENSPLYITVHDPVH